MRLQAWASKPGCLIPMEKIENSLIKFNGNDNGDVDIKTMRFGIIQTGLKFKYVLIISF